MNSASQGPRPSPRIHTAPLTGAARAEVALEATYRAQITPWLAVQPNVHYIRRPSADPEIRDALVLGIRTETSISLLGF